MQATSTQTRGSSIENDYRRLMIRELLIWLVGVPVTFAAVIGYVVL